MDTIKQLWTPFRKLWNWRGILKSSHISNFQGYIKLFGKVHLHIYGKMNFQSQTFHHLCRRKCGFNKFFRPLKLGSLLWLVIHNEYAPLIVFIESSNTSIIMVPMFHNLIASKKKRDFKDEKIEDQYIPWELIFKFRPTREIWPKIFSPLYMYTANINSGLTYDQ